MNPYDHDRDIEIAWCPGCGNFKIIDTVKKAMAELNMDRRNLVMVSGVGQAAKSPHYINCSFFDGLHGRTLPAATAIKASNPELTVVVESGEGCSYGEGGNHFIHAIRRNPDITVLVHNNMVYGLTKGQASPTSRRGFMTPVQVAGVYLEPFNPLAVAISLNAAFVARAFCGDEKQTMEILMAAVRHRGFALVDIFQNCVSFNKINTFKWYKDNTYYLDQGHDPGNRELAMKRALESGPYPLGVLYAHSGNKTFEENLPAYSESSHPLHRRGVNMPELRRLVDSKR